MLPALVAHFQEAITVFLMFSIISFTAHALGFELFVQKQAIGSWCGTIGWCLNLLRHQWLLFELFFDHIDHKLLDKGSDERNKVWVVDDLLDQFLYKSVRVWPAVEVLVDVFGRDSTVDHLCYNPHHEWEANILNFIGGCTVPCGEDVAEGLYDQISGHGSHLLTLGSFNGYFYFNLDENLSFSLIILIVEKSVRSNVFWFWSLLFLECLTSWAIFFEVYAQACEFATLATEVERRPVVLAPRFIILWKYTPSAWRARSGSPFSEIDPTACNRAGLDCW